MNINTILNKEVFDAFVVELNKKIPIEIRYKNESDYFKFLGKILFFNKGFMTDFVTTVGNKMYFPNKEYITGNVYAAMTVIAHEFQHIYDEKNKYGFLYKLMYAFPQILALLMLPLIFFKFIFIIPFILFLLPIPAYGRMILERRGYYISIYCSNEILKNCGFTKEERQEFLYKHCKFIDAMFTDSSYYYMWPFGLKNFVTSSIDDIVNDRVLSGYCTSEISESLKHIMN